MRIIINYPFPYEEAAARAVLESLETRADSIIAEADLSTIEGPKRLAAIASERFGKLDILVNNAGYNNICDLSQASDAEIQQVWDRTVNLNGRGTLLLTRAILPVHGVPHHQRRELHFPRSREQGDGRELHSLLGSGSPSEIRVHC
ncbi:hypothetical protein NKR23_g12295 [Pleurostoma richardsiae]|uniref:Uncharacterized protein n=1 Tax=Pleurostoma richardsiae TaxID=41990 RepID=A0AA38REU5_9PEZI|nr:hypothetical protein NKR23_g12295 [Pleurostoma richardsiae]